MSQSSQLFRVCRGHLQNHPLLRGMLMYSVTWPIGSLVQQTFESKEYNLSRTFKFGLFGSLYVAPTLYGWMRFSCLIWPKPTLIHSLTKAVVEQVTYSPFAICSFFLIVSYLEGASVENCIKEVKDKFIPTWKVAALVWPSVQTLNYSIIPERNRIPFIGLCSLCWTIFLAFVKYQQEKLKTDP